LGEGTGDFGYYRLSGGVVAPPVAAVNPSIATKGYGVLEMTGGTFGLNFAMFICQGGVAGATATVNIYGGLLKGSSTSDNYITMGGNAATGYGQLNVGGSGILNIAGGPNNNRGLGLMFADNNTNVVNLLPGGKIIANKVYAEKTTGRSIFNFNGGTLTTTNTSAVGGSFLQGLTAAYVYPGNAFIDTTSINLTVVQPLLATSDYGVTGFTLTSNGSGYIGAPAVVLLGGSGRGATATAQHDFNTNSATFGQITGLTITCPGTGYQPGDTLTVSLRGGGYLTPASATCTLGANPVSGGLTKLGSGVLTISGINTYEGATTINNGTLRLGVANALPTNSVVNVNGGTYDLNGFTVTNGAVNVTSGSIVNGRLPVSSITVDNYATLYAGLNGNDGLIKNGNGTLVLKGAAGTFPAGPLVVNGGTLTLVTVPPTNGLSYWLDATDTSKLTLENTNVTAWADSSTNGVSFTNSTPANQPVYLTNVINGRPAVRFNGTTQKMGASKAVNAQTVFIVNTPRSTANLDGIWGISGDIGIRVAGATSWQYPGNGGDFATGGGQMFINGISNSTFAASTPHLLTAVSLNQRTAWTTSIGQYYSNQRWFKGDIGEVLVYGSTLSTDERFSVEAYLKSKWFGVPNNTGLTVSLAADTILDLAGGSVTLANLAGSGTVSNGALTVTGEISPAGTNVIGTLTAKVNTTLSGKLVVDVDTDGNGDKLVVEGDLTLSSPTLEIQDLLGLSTIRVYTLVTCSGTLNNTFTSTNLPDRWTLRYTTDGKVQLYYKSGTMVRIM
jgi:autotransporter-associated beta strand protein